MIRNHVTYRGFDESRISYSHLVGDEFRTQFFGSPTVKENQAKDAKNYVLASVTCPVLIEDHDFDDLCPPIVYKDLFATILEQNPSSQATILVRDRTLGKAKKRQKELSKYLINTRKIAPERIRFVVTQKLNFKYGMDPYVEYRYIP
jgi:hypothetical protein